MANSPATPVCTASWRHMFDFDERDMPPLNVVRERLLVLAERAAEKLDMDAVAELIEAFDAASKELNAPASDQSLI